MSPGSKAILWAALAAAMIAVLGTASTAASERTIGIDKEVWFIASAPTGDQLVAYMESPDFNKSLGMFVQSREDFDIWFKERLANVTGVDLNDPPPMTLPEVVSTYEA